MNGRRYNQRQMTEEERMEFLRQSIESRDRKLGELAEQMDISRDEIRELNHEVRELNQTVDKFVQTTQLNFERLAKAMTGLTDHVVITSTDSKFWSVTKTPGDCKA